jgi:Ran GTPase-activating protein (RanGAP) involved in mRNA processing and transport
MLNTNENLVKLELSVQSPSFWDTFRVATTNQSLKSIFFWDTKFYLSTVDAILMKCFTMPSLQELSFGDCVFIQAAMDLFLKAISEHKILDTLTLQYVTIESVEAPFAIDCSDLQLRKLSLRGDTFNLETSNMLHQIANNPWIECLDLGLTDEPRSIPASLQFHSVAQSGSIRADYR